MGGLADELRRTIAHHGPITVAAYMECVLAHPRHGVYTSRDPFGAAGDFTTAPEISQMFGELIGLWCAVVWRAMGGPDPIALVELGPGRGTLIADAVRATKGEAPFLGAARLHLVETSRRLRDRQSEALAQAGLNHAPEWHDTLEEVPNGALLAVANEFFDALPVRQFQQTARGWRERLVGIEDEEGGFGFVLVPSAAAQTLVPPSLKVAPLGSVFEVSPMAIGIAHALAKRVALYGGAAIIIDYGHTDSAIGETLQAIRRHRFHDPLADPGTADITSHVDFAAPWPGGGRGRRRRPWTGAPGGLPRTPGHCGARRRPACRRDTRAGPRYRRRPPPPRRPDTNGDAVQSHGADAAGGTAARLRLEAYPFARPGRSSHNDAMINAATIASVAGVRHAFFSRLGGVSEGLYASLNCGYGSGDDGGRVADNRHRALARLGRSDDDLITLNQVHSADALVVEAAGGWAADAAPRADGLATNVPGVVLGILSADCAPVLLADGEAGVVGAAHAGWRGARAGILEATVAAMVRLGARPANTVAGIGPCIQRRSYEVGPEFYAEFVAEETDNGDFFQPARRSGHFLFDLPGYGTRRLKRLGLATVEALPFDTLSDDARFFSYRRNALDGERDYGRGLSAIVLEENRTPCPT